MYKTSDSNIEYLLSKTWIYKKNKTTNMKSVKKFSAMSAKDQPITESAKVSQEAVEELIKKIGFNSIDELKKEKDLLSKLEALSKSFANKDNISEEDLEEDRAEDIEDEVNAKGKPKSVEGEAKSKEGEEEVAAEVEEVEEDATEEEADDDLVSDEQEVTKEVPEEADEVSDEDGVPVADEEVETPKATKRIMAFEDFIKEKEETINKNVNYRDDNEEEEDYAVPVAASADALSESDESKGKDDEAEGDELEDKGDKKVDSEDDKEKADHYKGAVKSDDAEIKALKKDAKHDKEDEDEAEQNESAIMSFSNFVNEAYDKVVWGGNKGDDSESEEDEEDYEEDDKTDEGFDEVTLGGNKGDKSKTKKGEEDYEDDDSVEEDRAEDIEDEVNAKGKPKSVKEGVAKVITKVEDTEVKDQEAGDDGIAIPTIKGDGSETAAGIAGDIMNKGKVKTLSALAGKLVTTDQKVTTVIPDEANDVSEDGIEIPLVKEANIDEGWGAHAMSNGNFSIKDLRDLKISIEAWESGLFYSAQRAEIIAHIIKRAKVVGGEKLLSKIKAPNEKYLDKEFKKALKESVVNEEDITSDDQFKEYATAILKKAFGADYDEAKATDVIDGLISKHDGDYGAMVGALQSSMGESVVSEGYDFTMSDAADTGGTDAKTETKVFAKYLKYIGAKDASQAYLIDAEDAEDFEETGKAETVKGSRMYGNNKDESLVTLGTIKGIKAIKISDSQDTFYYVNAQGAKKLF